MKRNKHILLNLNEEQYNVLLYLSDVNQRKPSDQAYLLILEALNKEIIKTVDRGGADFKPLKYNN